MTIPPRAGAGAAPDAVAPLPDGGLEPTRVQDTPEIIQEGPLESCLVVIYGQDIGRKYPILDTMRVGRDARHEIAVDMDNVSRTHARLVLLDKDVMVEDLNSTNGTFVNDAEIKRAILKNGDLLKIGGTIFKFISGGNVEAKYHEEIYRMTIVDGLTQIHNKRYLLEFLDREMARCLRYGRPLTLIMFDIDHFKGTNDEHGHIAGDYVLKRLADVINQKIRREELFARYGGEEFVIVLPETDDEKGAYFAEKLRSLTERTDFSFEERPISVTISMGVAQMPPECQQTLAFIKLVDDRLYQAKRTGRNRVVAAPGLVIKPAE